MSTDKRLKQIKAKLATTKSKKPPPPNPSHHLTSLVSHIIVGFIIGYGLDNLFASKPLFLGVCILIAFIASIIDAARNSKS